MKSVFILVPSLDPTGPVKGAFALANTLAGRFTVTLVFLKHHPLAASSPSPASHPGVELRSLADHKGFYGKLAAYRDLLLSAQQGTACRPISISVCFSADMINAFCKRQAAIVSSIRSNLLKDYPMGYGLPGFPLALVHYLMLNRFGHVIAMTGSMAAQIGRFIYREPLVIGNFVDEAFLERYRAAPREGAFNILFLGSLTRRKQPVAVLQALNILVSEGVDMTLDIVGDGPLASLLERKISSLGLGQRVRMHGHLSDPYQLLATADALVLPSLSEGLARASLESLFLGVPCVLRDVDGNKELVTEGVNGALFRNNAELAAAMLRVARLARQRKDKSCLLPLEFRQAHAESRFLHLVEQFGR